MKGIQVKLYNLTYIVYTCMSDPRSEIDRLRERIQAGERGGSEADREVVCPASRGVTDPRAHVYEVPFRGSSKSGSYSKVAFRSAG